MRALGRGRSSGSRRCSPKTCISIRRIEADVGGNEIRIRDRVVNHGFRRTPHMFFYHVNVGYPVLDEGSRYLAPIEDVVFAAHAGERYRRRASATAACRRRRRFRRAGLAARVGGGRKRARRMSRWSTTGSGSASRSSTRKDQLPCLYQWQDFQSGHYALGIEPSTHHVLGDQFARERGEMIWLEHDEESALRRAFRVLDGAGDDRRGGSADPRVARAAGQRIFRSRPAASDALPGR